MNPTTRTFIEQATLFSNIYSTCRLSMPGPSALPLATCGANCRASCDAQGANSFFARANDFFFSTKTEREIAVFSRENLCSGSYFIARNHLIIALKPDSAESAIRPDEALGQATDHSKHRGGTMSIKRSIIVPAILTLSAAGSVAAASSTVALSAATPSVVAASPAYLLHG